MALEQRIVKKQVLLLSAPLPCRFPEIPLAICYSCVPGSNCPYGRPEAKGSHVIGARVLVPLQLSAARDCSSPGQRHSRPQRDAAAPAECWEVCIVQICNTKPGSKATGEVEGPEPLPASKASRFDLCVL